MFRGVYRDKQAHPDDWHLILERAKAAGVQKVIITGGNLAESREAIEQTRKEPALLYSTVGCHPTRCKEMDQHKSGAQGYLNELLDTINSSKNVVAVGECGLDYDRLHFCPKEDQKRNFELQFELAEKTRLPMFLHNRNTGDDFCTMIRANRHRFTQGVVHSFTGTLEEMRQLVALDLFIGINGCSLKTQENLDVVREIPADKLMLETDAPWCDLRPTHASAAHLANIPNAEMSLYAPPSKKKEKFEMGSMVKSRCEPCAIGLVLHAVASVRNVDPSELAETVWNNTCTVFFPPSS